MTSNSIAAFRSVEEARHNRVSEEYNRKSLLENIRHNKAYEKLTQRGQTLNYQSAIYSADTHAQATRYAADRNYSASIYAANTNAATQRYVASINAQTARYAANASRQASAYSADRHYASTVYSANKSSNASKYATRQGAANTQAKIANDYRMNEATNNNRIITTGLSGLSGIASSLFRMAGR